MERGQPWTKAFGRLRKRLAVTRAGAWGAADNLDLHGVRRWAIATMRDALNRGAQGFTMGARGGATGHKAEDMGRPMTARYAGEGAG